MPKLEEIFETVAIVCHCYDRLAVFNKFSRVFSFEQVDALIDFWDELYSSEISKDDNREQRLKEPFVTTKMLKLTQNLEHLNFSGTRQVCRFLFFFSVHCIKQTDSLLQCVCSSVIDHRGRQNVVKKHQWFSRLRLACHFAVFITVIYYWTDAWQHGIYL